MQYRRVGKWARRHTSSARDLGRISNTLGVRGHGRKAEKFGARGTTVKAFKTRR